MNNNDKWRIPGCEEEEREREILEDIEEECFT